MIYPTLFYSSSMIDPTLFHNVLNSLCLDLNGTHEQMCHPKAVDFYFE